MKKETMLSIVRQHLSTRLNCKEEAFITEGVTFVSAKHIKDVRQDPFLEMTTMGKGVVVSADIKILPQVKALLQNKSREEIFEFPFIYGQSLYYLPDLKRLKAIPFHENFVYEIKEGDSIGELLGLTGFEHSLVFDSNGNTSTQIVLYAKKEGKIIALASAAMTNNKMWEMGVDVLPPYRKVGLATTLISHLAIKILEKGIVPYYCAASSNIGSQAVAYQSGFVPSWISTYKNILDKSSPFNEVIKDLKL